MERPTNQVESGESEPWFSVAMAIALSDAVSHLEARFREAMRVLEVDPLVDLGDFLLYLPEGYPYTLNVLRRLYFCLVTVSARLEPWKRQWARGLDATVGCSCLAEELMLRAIGLEAERVLEDESAAEGPDSSPVERAEWHAFHALAFEDADFEVLFESGGNNVLALAALKGFPGTLSMPWRDWFRPFNPGRGVSPLCWDGSLPHAPFGSSPNSN